MQLVSRLLLLLVFYVNFNGVSACQHHGSASEKQTSDKMSYHAQIDSEEFEVEETEEDDEYEIG